MNACPEWNDRLMRHALGGPAEPAGPADAALAAHLAACPACSEALAAGLGKAGEMDAALRKLAAVEPPAYGPERVLARIEAQPTGLFQRVRAIAALAALAVLLLIAGAVVALRRPPRPGPALPPGATALSAWRSPTHWLLRSPADPLLKEVPRLGQGFLETKSSGEKNAQ